MHSLLLLQRADTNRSLQDLEGYTAFDLYNSTLNGTKPRRDTPHGELYTWGANRNAALGFADGDDRAHPDQVHIQKKDTDIDSETSHLVSRFFPIYVRQVQMSKLHTAVITSESGGNLHLCGFGSGGRLGPGQHTQYSLKPLQQLAHIIVSVALGQDHTLALTKTGEVLSWGLNRFSQLGYIIEGPAAGESFGKTDEPIQASPRKVLGTLKKELVKGVAASKSASVCWTEVDVYTWGTNNGQLGYDKAAQPVQILPRKATKVTQPVVDISISDSAMACLLDTHDVICIWNDRHIRIVFPGHGFPAEMQPYRPPQAIKDAKIAKITSCEDMFAALSYSGELFTFSVANPSEAGAASAKEKSGFKPQRVWALRKKFSSVKDVALGSDGSIIVCTESGHVFVRTRNLKSGQTSSSGKALKFQRLSTLQRVTQVCANSTGAFGALRVEYNVKPIQILGHTFAQDLTDIQPYLHVRTVSGHSRRGSDVLLQAPLIDYDSSTVSHLPHDDDAEDSNVKSDIRRIGHIIDILELQLKSLDHLPKFEARLPHGADVLIHTSSGFVFPAHKVILGARSTILRTILGGSAVHPQGSKISLELFAPKPADGHLHLKLTRCRPISLLILLTFIYTDEVLAPWDHRVAKALKQPSKELKIDLGRIKVELRGLAELLELPTLATTLDSPIKSVPTPSLEEAMQHLFDSSQSPADVPSVVLQPDVILLLADREVYCHSTILRARSEFFANFFDDEEWTRKRWDASGVLRVNMKHLHWRVMEYVLKFMCFGAGEKMFDSLECANTIDEVLEFMFDVMAAANELLLDRLVLQCSAVILQHVNIHNACFILADATYLHAEQLTERIQSFITVNMELFLETGMLDDIPPYLIKQLAAFARQKQLEKSPTSRSDALVQKVLERHAEWLALRDFPAPLDRPTTRKESATPRTPSKRAGASPQQSPRVRPQKRGLKHLASTDDIFAMDEAETPPLRAAEQAVVVPQPPAPIPVWKVSSTPRVDMKTIMAKAAAPTLPRRAPDTVMDEAETPPSRAAEQPVVAAPQPPASTPVWKASSTPRVDMKTVMAEAAAPTPPRRMPDTRAGRGSPSKHTPGTEAGPSSRPIPAPAPPTTPRRPSGPPAIPGLGPRITPTRQPAPGGASPSGVRRASGKAWAQPSFAPVPAPLPLPAPTPTPVPTASTTVPNATAPTSTTTKPHAPPTSFLAIQQSELSQLEQGPARDRRSLREIQEEEQALRAEAEFLTWWAEEEERVRSEGLVSQSGGGEERGRGTGRRGRGRGKADQERGKADQGRGKADQGRGRGRGEERRQGGEKERERERTGQGQGQGQEQAGAGSASARRGKPRGQGRRGGAPAVAPAPAAG
ncbi:hypothetical protein DXG01_000829 [Tephrocybe rancida]|nr:hypothetical protein DXG01_000829 [Tephrocybe rancida]